MTVYVYPQYLNDGCHYGTKCTPMPDGSTICQCLPMPPLPPAEAIALKVFCIGVILVMILITLKMFIKPWWRD